jgi:PAS domain S-box-containing protein
LLFGTFVLVGGGQTFPEAAEEIMPESSAPCDHGSSTSDDPRCQRWLEPNLLGVIEQLLESAPEAMVIIDSRGRIVALNSQTELLSGYNRQELLGQPIERLVPERFHTQHCQQRADYAAQPRCRPMGVGIEVIGRRKDGSEFPAEVSLRPLHTAEGLLVSSAIRDLSERKRTEHTLRENEAQLLAAQRIQQHLLPRESPRLAGFDVAGQMYPAELAAGDYFDYLPMSPPAMGFVIGDVAGHGVGPALLMAVTHAHLRALTQMHADPSEILARANAVLVDGSDADHFVTLLFAKLDPVERLLVFTGAGHPPGYVLATDGSVKASLVSNSLPLGVTAEATFETSLPIRLESGDLVVLLTDGLLEARSPQGTPFGEQGVLDSIRASRTQPARHIVEILYRSVQDHMGQEKLADDATVVIVKVDGG